MANIKVERESIENIASSIRGKNHTTDKYTPSEMSGAIDSLPTYEPNTTKTISSNGTTDVSTYQYADVNVPQPSGSINITSNGTTDVTNYETANVNVKIVAPDGFCLGNSSGYYETQQDYDDVWQPFINSFNWSNVEFASMMFKGQWFSNEDEDTFFNCVQMPSDFKPTDISQMFMQSNFKGIQTFDTSLATDFSQLCSGCSELTTFPLLNVTSCTSMVKMVQSCSKLNQTSIDNILQMCISATSNITQSERRFSVLYGANPPSSIQNKITGSSYYQSFIDSGWSIT